MRTLFLLCLLPLPAFAQVTTNDQALESLKPKPAAAPSGQTDVLTPAEAPKRPVHHSVVHHAATGDHEVAHSAAHPAAKPAPLPTVPLAPPTNPVILPPPQTLPVHPRPQPPPVPIKADAPGAPSFIPGGIRLTFGAGVADLNQANDEALLDIAARAKADPALTVSVTAWAPGTTEDPSTPRRLSLDRALAVRAVLINAGLVSDRVLAVAKGFTNIEGGPPDRVDIGLAHPKSTPAGAPAPAAAPSGAAPSGATQAATTAAGTTAGTPPSAKSPP
jgi:outer membrane protein OmpA-like peptidoglycan-associated protein